MQPTSQFEVLRKRPQLSASGKYTNAGLAAGGVGTVTAPRGLALGAHATDGESFALGQHNNFLGVLTRRVIVGGLTVVDRVFGVTSATPVGLESPFTDGLEVTVEKIEELELETPYLYSGTGQIDTNTAVPSNLSIKDGRWRVSQTGEIVNATLSANNLTSTDGVALRIRMVLV